MSLCPCGSQKNVSECCHLFITGQKKAATPEQLMRSRYAAYTKANIDYIIKTMKGPAAENFDSMSARTWASTVKWLGLEVIKTSFDGTEKGYVEFIATFEEQGKKNYLHELSEFHKIDGEWYYVDGQLINSAKAAQVGRNETCPCGSGKKYKKCCL